MASRRGEGTSGQVPVTAAAGGSWDVIVVGAGPAGSSAAHELARRGRRVLLVDRRRFPRDKTCGDALIPDAQACLARLGLLERVRERAWRAAASDVWSPSGARVPLDCEILVLPRLELDMLLAAAAVEAGAVFTLGTVGAIEDRGVTGGASVHVTVGAAGASPAVRLDARAVLLATGAQVAPLARCGLLTRRRASAVALRAYLDSPVRVDRLAVSFDRAVLPGYAWLFPVGEQAGVRRYNVGVGLVLGPAHRGERPDDEASPALRTMLERFLATAPVVRDVAAAAVARTPAHGALLRCGLTGAEAWRGGAVLAAGEAIGATFPLTGEGIGKAMATALLAAEAIDGALGAGDSRSASEALATYPARVEAELRPVYRGYAVAERWMARPWLADAVLGRAARRSGVRRALTGILTETVDPSRLFSPLGVARALLLG